MFLNQASQGLQYGHRVSALFCCPKARELDGLNPGHGEADMNQKPILVNHVLEFTSQDYLDDPRYREYVKEFIKWDSLRGPVFVRVDGQKCVPVTTIARVDEIVDLLQNNNTTI